MEGRIIGVYLAAGSSRRFGVARSKLAQSLGGMNLGNYGLAAALASELSKVIIVTKQQDSLLWCEKRLLAQFDGKWLQVPCNSEGLADSLRAGVGRAEAEGADAVLIILADQPFITVDLLNDIIRLARSTGSDYVGATSDCVVSPPMLLGRRLFGEVNGLRGDVGARRVIEQHRERGLLYEVSDGMLFDVDTEDDLVVAHRLLAQFQKGCRLSVDGD